ncbi:MFS transporter [Neogemmobacter tilapiae]|uniref:MFS transporter n=1 Tax=Neogemmobacter tilapiae TaxID=875041 RepID=A0A918TDM1_9RHOB|nr:MFS transporter [Gemmobacter tilapiae]GHC43271.1 MFS transporter [Gemmobacter tilapiae]
MRNFWIVIAIWAVSLGAAAQFGKFAVLFDRVALAYPGQPLPMIGLVVSTVGFVGLIFGTTAGLFVSALGYRQVLVVALLAGAAISAVEALMPPLPILLGLRALEGLSHLAIVVAAPVMTAQVSSPRWQGAAMTLYSSFFAVSFAALGLIGPSVADWGGLPAIYLGHAAYMLAGAVLMALLLPRDLRGPLPRLTLPALLTQHGRIYASPYEAAPAMGFVCYTITYVAFLTLMPQQFLGRPEQAVLATFMPLVSVGISLTLGVWGLSRFGAVRMVQAGFAAGLAFALMLWLVWGQATPTVWAAFGVAAALGVVQSASFATIPQLNPEPEARARAAGAIAQLGNLGTTSGTPLLVWLIAQAGGTGLALFLGLFCALGIAIHAAQAARRG